MNLLRQWRDDFTSGKSHTTRPDGDEGRVCLIRDEFLRLNDVEVATWNSMSPDTKSRKKETPRRAAGDESGRYRRHAGCSQYATAQIEQPAWINGEVDQPAEVLAPNGVFTSKTSRREARR